MEPVVPGTEQRTGSIERTEVWYAGVCPANVVRPAFVHKVPEPVRKPRYSCEKSWEGTVLSIQPDGFSARLCEPGGAPDLEAAFTLEEVAPDDLELVQPGAIFYWNLGYRDSPSGERERFSMLRFRRLPTWTESELRRARQAGDELADALGWE
ncbi:MAG: hypothetical protein AB1758_01840 [Candidatus Eremiobacterota bacterium]